MSSVFILQHVHKISDEREDVKFIGVYKSQVEAEAAIKRLENLPGFMNSKNGFQIDKYELNKDHWREGFISL